MKLRQWFEADSSRVRRMAAHFGVSTQTVYTWRDRAPAANMRAIREFTGGAVELEDMVWDSPTPPGSAIASATAAR